MSRTKAMATPLNPATRSLIRNAREAQGLLLRHAFHTVSMDLSCRLPYHELTKLYRMIETSLPNHRHRIVQFMSAYHEEGASEIALETAILVARMIGQRVLFIDTSATLAHKRKSRLPGSPGMALDTLLISGDSPYKAIAQAAGSELYFAMLCERGMDGLSPISLNAIETALENLRVNFDLIVIDSQGLLSDALGLAIAKLADGSVMVIEAERTRAPVAMECKRLIEDGGGKLIGAVMNRRRMYIPDALYHLFG